MKIIIICIIAALIILQTNIYALDNLEGLSFGVEGGLLYSPNAKKFSVNSASYYSNKIKLSSTNFVTIGAYGRYGISDEMGLEFGISQSYTSDVKIILYRYELIYMLTPYKENRYYVKFGGVRNQTKSNVYETAGRFAYSNGLIYTVGVELGYTTMPLNITLSYISLKSRFIEEEGWVRNRSNYDLSGLIFKTSFNIKL